MEKNTNLKNNGFVNLFLGLLMLAFPLLIILFSDNYFIIFSTIFIAVVGVFWLFGLFIVQPNQTKVLLFFGKYKGTVKNNGFFWLNPFYTKKKVSLRVRNLESDIIKVNDEQGNPILISAVVVWRVVDTYKAVFDIETQEEIDVKTGAKKTTSEESYQNFVKIQAESALRRLAHSYPYDDINSDDENKIITLRSGVDIINETLAKEIRDRLDMVGIEVLEARISNLSYAPEIASVMLQRQQAQAIISARARIVEGAVGMVEMAISELETKEIAKFSEEEKGRMVNNLMVVLCGQQGTSPVINMD